MSSGSLSDGRVMGSCPLTLVRSYSSLLDEPTSALDAKNRQVVVKLLTEKKSQGCALIGIFHDKEVKNDLCTRELLFEGN